MAHFKMCSVLAALIVLAAAADFAHGAFQLSRRHLRQQDNGYADLFSAMEANDTEGVKKLLGDGSDPNVQQNDTTPLMIASGKGNAEMVKALLDAGADPGVRTNDGWNAILLGTAAGSLEVVEQLILSDEGYDINDRQTASGNTLVMVAALNSQSDLVDFLVALGADMNIRNFRGETALHFAVLEGATDIVENLIKYGADVNPRTNSGLTPLHYATVVPKNGPVILALIKGGSSVKILTNRKMSAMHFAKIFGNDEAAKAFEDNGVDVSVVDADGDVANDLVCACKDNGNLRIDVGELDWECPATLCEEQ